MSHHRDEILAACRMELGSNGTDEGEHYVDGFFDEMTGAVMRDSGARESSSPLPVSSNTAARFGVDR